MTQAQLRQSLEIVSTNYNKPLDSNVMAFWWEIFKDFDGNLFKMACFKVVKESDSRFLPPVHDFIDAYENIKRDAERKQYEILREEQKLLVEKQAYCFLCDNSGLCLYMKSGYEYAARCICTHGKDLNKFSIPQVQENAYLEIKEHFSQRDKTIIKRGKNPFYFQTVQEALGDDYAIFEARRKERYLSRKTVSDNEKSEFLNIRNTIGNVI